MKVRMKTTVEDSFPILGRRQRVDSEGNPVGHARIAAKNSVTLFKEGEEYTEKDAPGGALQLTELIALGYAEEVE